MALYWYIQYTSCEGHYRWTIVKTPEDWCAEDVEARVTQNATMGDDPAIIINITESHETEYVCGEDYT